MALSKTVEFKGVSINSAYHRVWNVLVTKDVIKFGVGIYANSNSEMLDSFAYQCAYDLNGANPIKQAYEHLKNLPEFADATDV